jgi:hypothetical protein
MMPKSVIFYSEGVKLAGDLFLPADINPGEGAQPEVDVARLGGIAPRPILFITTDNDRLVPPEESEAMYARAGGAQEARGGG